MSTTPLRTPRSTHRSPPRVTRRRRTPPQAVISATWDPDYSPPRFDTNSNTQRRLVFPHRLAAQVYEPFDPRLRSMPSRYNSRTPVNRHRSKLPHPNKNNRHGGARRSRRTRRHQKR